MTVIGIALNFEHFALAPFDFTRGFIKAVERLIKGAEMSRNWLYIYSFIFIGLILISIAPAGAAPSFDCSVAIGRSETAICADATLSNLDSQYAATYSRLRLLFDQAQNATQRQQLLQRARDFLKERNACGDSAPCLRDAYNTVLADLQTLSPPPNSSPVPSNVPAQATGNLDLNNAPTNPTATVQPQSDSTSNTNAPPPSDASPAPSNVPAQATGNSELNNALPNSNPTAQPQSASSSNAGAPTPPHSVTPPIAQAPKSDWGQFYTLGLWIGAFTFAFAVILGLTGRAVVYYDRKDFFLSNAPIFIFVLTGVIVSSLGSKTDTGLTALQILVMLVGYATATWFLYRSFRNSISYNRSYRLGIFMGIVKSAMMMIAAFWVLLALVMLLRKDRGRLSEYAFMGAIAWLFVALINGSKFEERLAGTSSGSEKQAGPDRPYSDGEEVVSCYEILGVHPSSSLEIIKSAYRERLKQYHPDRVNSLGPKLRELAEQETKNLNIAYEEAMSRCAI